MVAEYAVDSSEDEREQLGKFISRGEVSARKASRARILRGTDEGRTSRGFAGAVAELVFANSIRHETIRRVLENRSQTLATKDVVHPGSECRVRRA